MGERRGRTRCVYRLTMSTHEEKDEKREEEEHAHKGIIKRDVAEATGNEQAHHGDHGQDGRGRLLLILLMDERNNSEWPAVYS